MEIKDSLDTSKITLVTVAGGLIMLAAVAYVLFVTFPQDRQTVECVVPQQLTVKYDRQQPEELKGSHWVCGQVICNRLMSTEEWVGRYCYRQGDTVLCRIQLPQGNANIPIDQLNLTAIQECAEYQCIQEILVRNASYILPLRQ